jgi:hypothetical protein
MGERSSDKRIRYVIVNNRYFISRPVGESACSQIDPGSRIEIFSFVLLRATWSLAEPRRSKNGLPGVVPKARLACCSVRAGIRGWAGWHVFANSQPCPVPPPRPRARPTLANNFLSPCPTLPPEPPSPSTTTANESVSMSMSISIKVSLDISSH